MFNYTVYINYNLRTLSEDIYSIVGISLNITKDYYP